MEMNKEMLKLLTKLDVDAALGLMNPIKAPRLDGMTALFYLKIWKVVEEKVSSTMLDS